MKKSQEVKKITVKLPVELIERIKKVAVYLESDENWVVQCGMKKFIDTHEEEFRRIYEGAEQVKRGEVIFHEEMKKYIQQLINEIDESPLGVKEKEHTTWAANEL